MTVWSEDSLQNFLKDLFIQHRSNGTHFDHGQFQIAFKTTLHLLYCHIKLGTFALTYYKQVLSIIFSVPVL